MTLRKALKLNPDSKGAAALKKRLGLYSTRKK
jgi:hypothetical protein